MIFFFFNSALSFLSRPLKMVGKSRVELNSSHACDRKYETINGVMNDDGDVLP